MKSSTRPIVKFAFTLGAAGLSAFGAATLIMVALMGVGFVRLNNRSFLCTSLLAAASVLLVAYVTRAARHAAITQFVSVGLPLLLYGVAFFINFMGGDAQEHLVRGFLHDIQRVLPREWIGFLIDAVMLGVPFFAASLLWLAMSILQTSFDLKIPLILSAAFWGFVGFELAMITLVKLILERVLTIGVVAALLTLAVGLLLALLVHFLRVGVRAVHVLAILGGTFLLLVLAAGAAVVKSSPEQRLPTAPALQTLDNSRADSMVDARKGWARFPLLPDGVWGGWSTPAPKVSDEAHEITFPRRPRHFGGELDRGGGMNLWFEEGEHRYLLEHYNCADIALYQISEDRVLATGCTQFGVFGLHGKRIGGGDFVRPELRFIALAHNYRRFALILYLVGFGDPPHLEEENIVVYDALDAHAILAVKLDPLPPPQSWAALSPDGLLLAVDAGPKCQIYQLPLRAPESSRVTSE